jgi:transcriptional regulator with XRE-family HTH domain
MNDNDERLLSGLNSLRTSRGWSQEDVSCALGMTQGHLSKVLGRKVPISPKMRVKLNALLASRDSDETGAVKLESDLILAVRSSSPFRALMRAALDMQKYVLKTSKQRPK